MDLLDFDQAALYFDEPVAPGIEALIVKAGAHYGEDDAASASALPLAETFLLKAYFMAPESLLVLVALYRYFFYQHRLDDALTVANRTLALTGRRLGFPDVWTHLHPDFLGEAVLKSMGLLRFYLSVLKATAYINLRLGHMQQGRAQIEKLIELDSHDRFGGKALLATIVDAVADRISAAA